MESKHTPGPWVYHPGDVINAPCIKAGKSGICLLQQNAHPEIRDANAHLIASAPELLEALKDALKSIKYRNDNGANELGLQYLIEGVIAKAEGRL